MKILHTADWHLGKKLYTASRLDEQRAAIDELVKLADECGADVVLVAGDIFDSCNPSAEAEELFYAAAVRLAKDRVFIALAGNHDDPDRLAAPDALARVCNVILAGRSDLRNVRTAQVTGGVNSLSVARNGERLHIAVLPFPQEARLEPGERYESYTDMVRAHLKRGAACFTPDGFNMVAGHLFTVGGETTDGDERMLGSACIVPNDVFPDCDYVALGHVHKPMTVSAARNIYYAGSLLNYHFGDTTQKRVLLIDTKTRSVESIPLSSGKKLTRVNACDFHDAYEKLMKVDGYAELVYSGAPLKPGETAALKNTPCVNVRVELSADTAAQPTRAMLSDRELFELYYKSKFGETDDAVTELFLRFAGGEDVTA